MNSKIQILKDIITKRKLVTQENKHELEKCKGATYPKISVEIKIQGFQEFPEILEFLENPESIFFI